MATKKIALDAGHGLKTAGKQTPDGIKEWTLNDKVRDKVAEYLKDYDVEIIFPDKNEGNTDESLTSRRTMYLNQKVDAAVSIHHNALSGAWNNATGVEIFTDKNPTSKDKELAKAIYKNLPTYTGLKGRGIKEENWSVINQNQIPATLVEGGFMDSTIDYPIITSTKGQEGYAKAVAEGLIEFLSLEKKQIGWIKDNVGWWYKNPDGSYPKSQWLELDAWYYFDEKGYAVCNDWKKISYKGKFEWFYFDENCKMVTGWKQIKYNNKLEWFYLDPTDGYMYASKWITYKGNEYYLDKNGVMATNCYIKSTGKNLYYWVNENGIYEPQWDTATPNLTKYKLVV